MAADQTVSMLSSASTIPACVWQPSKEYTSQNLDKSSNGKCAKTSVVEQKQVRLHSARQARATSVKVWLTSQTFCPLWQDMN